ncbi:UNVERIFIED_CONTAM: hypothetical protein FKN15_041148 [Acipenser sinensis]
MESQIETLPFENASILSESTSQEGHRLWIGNIDPKITEYNLVKLLERFGKVKQFDFLFHKSGPLEGQPRGYNLVKLLERFGKVKQFDFLFHKSGPLEGQPRGYCFVNFETKEEAERAIQRLNGKLALSKKLVVRWAHAQVKRFDQFRNDKVLPLSLEPSSSTDQTPTTLTFDQFRNDKVLPLSLEPSSSTDQTPTTLTVNAKIKAIEAKLKMMADNPDADYSGPSAYSYNKPTEKKRTAPYSKQPRRTKR